VRSGLFIFRKCKQVVVWVCDGKFGGAIESLLQAVDDVYLVFYAFEKSADAFDPDVKEQGAAVLAADHGEGVADALKGLEHKGDVAAGDHRPDEVVVGFGGDGHDEVKAEAFVKFDGGANVFDEEIGGEGFHVGCFFR